MQYDEEMPLKTKEQALSPIDTPGPAEHQSEMHSSDVVTQALGTNPTAFATVKTPGKFIKKLRASTKIPIEHKMDGDSRVSNKTRPVKVISLDNNCQMCAPSNQNEIVMKAFKMACLQYKPSPVNFEQQKYLR